MNRELVKDIRRNLRAKSTFELIQIWRENDHTEYSAEAFEAIRLILEGRAVIPPPRSPQPATVVSRWFSPKCPVDRNAKAGIEESMLWLISEFGLEFLHRVQVILPTADFFPDTFSEDPSDVRKLVNRACGYMGVNPERLDLKFYTEERPGQYAFPSVMPYEWSRSGTGGHYLEVDGKAIIEIETSQLGNPMSLVATLAHELGHVLLLGDGRISRDREDHEPLTDLLTVFFGMGVFTANSAFHFSQWHNVSMQGWSANTQGYLTEPMYGYALALFSWVREESKPDWEKYLEGDAGVFYKRGLRYLEATGDSLLRPGHNSREYASAFVGLGNLQDFRSDLDGAIRTFGKAIELDPKNVLAYLSRGLTRADKGEREEAIADFNRAIELDPNCVEAYHRRGLTFYDQRNWEKAITDFSKVIELDPDNALAYVNRGNMFTNSGDWDDANVDYNKSLALNSCNPFAYASRGNMHARREEWEMAITDYTEGLELDPNYEWAYLNRGYAKAESGDLGGAIADYSKALELDPHDAEAFCLRGYAWQDQGDLAKAIADYSQAIKLDPSYADAHLNRGITLMDRGDLKRAIADLDRALDIDQTLAWAFLQRGLALMLSGKGDQAQLDFKQCLKLDKGLKSILDERIKEVTQKIAGMT